MATSLAFTGDLLKGRAHYDKALALYDPTKHRALALRFGQDVGVVIRSFRAWVLWLLGYPDDARADIESALINAREIGHAATLMYALYCSVGMDIYWGKYQDANALDDELGALAREKDAPFWKAAGTVLRGCIFSVTGNPSMAVDNITIGSTAWGATQWRTLYLPFLAKAHAERRQFDDAWRCIGEATIAVETTNERWLEAEVYRVAGEIALMSPQRGTVKAEAYFERALSVARHQQAKSWELRAAMSMARLWRDQGKRDEARDLLAPVYGWFTEGFDTLDLKEAKALLEELAV